MIKKIIKAISLMIFIIVILLMSASAMIFKDPLLPFKFSKYILTYEYANYIINKDNTKIERENREINIETANKWIESYFGPVVSKVIKCEYIGKRRGWSWHPDSEFVIHIPFCEDKTMFVDSETQEVFTSASNISTDPKFQHLYSEWVKKQVGLDDENVELGFTGNYDKPYIEFNKIEHLSEDYREIFENTHNLYLGTIIVNNYHINEQNYINCFNKIKDDIYLKYYFITGKPNEPYSLFVYIDNYRFIYNYPEEKIASVSKKNGETWTDY